MFYLTMHSAHFIYGYMKSDICHPIDRTAHTTAYVNQSWSTGARTRNSSVGPP